MYFKAYVLKSYIKNSDRHKVLRVTNYMISVEYEHS